MVYKHKLLFSGFQKVPSHPQIRQLADSEKMFAVYMTKMFLPKERVTSLRTHLKVSCVPQPTIGLTELFVNGQTYPQICILIGSVFNVFWVIFFPIPIKKKGCYPF